MQTAAELKELLHRIDRKSYPAYKDTRGTYRFPGYVLSIDHVQGDPFAAPSKVSIHMTGSTAGFPGELYTGRVQRIALQDDLTRQFAKAAGKYAFRAKGSGKSGMISISRCAQEILERTACHINQANGDITLRLEVGFPARGRTIDAGELEKILFTFLPDCVKQSLYYQTCDQKRVRALIDLAEDQQFIREELGKKGLVAFVANGAILPRESGVSPRPMKEAIAFQSPKEMEVTLSLPHKGEVKGMGIPCGITLIVGGGYHGKSTLLNALELGVYNHIPGDGREYVITDDRAMKIRAEDGRSIRKTDISMFINNLPNGKDTKHFYSEDASGSTSQAANVVEAMEAGASALFIDEDTSATNFMIRDELMQRVIHRDMEPITPFIERIRELYQVYGISTVIVAGSSGAYFQMADHIVQMDQYVPKEITSLAKEEAKAFPVLAAAAPKGEKPDFSRCPKASREFLSSDRLKIKTMGVEALQLNREAIDLRYVEQLVDAEQVTALGYCLTYAQKHLLDGKMCLQAVVEKLYQLLEKDGLEAICANRSNMPGMAMPRRQEIFACFNRYRSL